MRRDRRGGRKSRSGDKADRERGYEAGAHGGTIFHWVCGWATPLRNGASGTGLRPSGRHSPSPALLSVELTEDNNMADTIASRLEAAGVTLPEAAAPAANYVPSVIYGGLLQTSGQLPLDGGKLAVSGKLGAGVSLEDGQKAARLCAINILAQAKSAVSGDWSRLGRLLKLTVFVASDAGFTEQHKVANGASDFLVEILGENGRHSRSAVGVPALPMDAAVEIEALFEVA